MELAQRRATHSPSRTFANTRDAWTAFWQEPGQSRCVAGAPGIWQALEAHWVSFAARLPTDTRVLDLGCGAGAVARLIVASRDDVQVTGVDFARIPLTLDPRFDLLSETEMERMPFADACFGAVVSQFGFEYGDTTIVAHELRQVACPGAVLSYLVHHADSAIVATNRVRLGVLEDFLSPRMRAAFCDGDAPGFHTHMREIVSGHAGDSLALELARALPSRLLRAPRERHAIWHALEDALSPERSLAHALDRACVPPSRIDAWLQPLREACRLDPPGVLRESDGTPVAWRIQGTFDA